MLAVSGPDYGGQFFAGWLTEYSLSIDNLFVFLIIMTRLDVPRKYQPTALLVGIVLALVLRGVFIAIGAAAISEFSWIFYLFGLFLIVTGVKLARDQGESEADFEENRVVRWIRRVVPTSADYDGVRLTTREAGRRVVTPMFIVLVALGTTDLLFALDSIPAIYGLTQEPYLVLMANIFALMGLRQLYFLIGGLLQRLVYLSIGLAILLGFIGVKLVSACAARERAALHQRRRARLVGAGPADLVLAALHHRHARGDDVGEPGCTTGGSSAPAAVRLVRSRAAPRTPARCRLP